MDKELAIVQNLPRLHRISIGSDKKSTVELSKCINNKQKQQIRLDNFN